jgi:hypothetical protein
MTCRIPSIYKSCANQSLSNSRQAIKKYIQANNTLTGTSETAFSSHLNRALKSGEENGVFERPKGTPYHFLYTPTIAAISSQLRRVSCIALLKQWPLFDGIMFDQTLTIFVYRCLWTREAQETDP